MSATQRAMVGVLDSYDSNTPPLGPSTIVLSLTTTTRMGGTATANFLKLQRLDVTRAPGGSFNLRLVRP